MRTVEWGVTPELAMVMVEVDAGGAPPAPPPVDHVVLVDVSGSMAGDLPALRAGLVEKLDMLVGPRDTVTLGWFSGAGEHGLLLEGFGVPTLREREKIRKLVDRWLRPVGLTGFLGPIEDALIVASKLSGEAAPGAAAVRFRSLMFMSDGHDNQHPRDAILSAMGRARHLFQAVTVVEHGYMADRDFLRRMAERAGGQHVFSEDLQAFEPLLGSHLGKGAVPAIKVPVPGYPLVVGSVAVGIESREGSSSELLTLPLDGGIVEVPPTVRQIYRLEARPPYPGALSLRNAAISVATGTGSAGQGQPLHSEKMVAVAGAYGLAAALSQRSEPEAVDALLAVLGDVALIRQFAGAFGKQQQSRFQRRATAAALGGPCLEAGHDPRYRAPDDQATVLDLLEVLAGDGECRLLLDDPAWKYLRIGRGSEPVDGDASFEDALAASLAHAMEDERDPARRAELAGMIAEAAERRAKPLKFAADPMPLGVEVSSLTWNEESPNISVLVRREGQVDVSGRTKGTPFDGKLGVIRTHIWRNYAIVRDGLVNMDVLPLLVGGEVMLRLMKMGVEGETSFLRTTGAGLIADGRKRMAVDLRGLPVVSRKMVRGPRSGQAFLETKLRLARARAEQKVWKAIAAELAPRGTDAVMAAKYGLEEAAFLERLGFGKNGFQPRSLLLPPKDWYPAHELVAKIKGLSSLPSMNELAEQRRKGKITTAGSLMLPAIEDHEKFMAGNVKPAEAVRRAEGKRDVAVAEARSLIYQVAREAFSVIVGRAWFDEWKGTPGEGKGEVEIGGKKVAAEVLLREIQVPV